MKRAIINQLGQLSEQMKGYVAALNYRYLNLCVKAEEASLLPIQVPIEDELKNLEDVAYAGKKDGDDYSLYVVPKFQDDMRDIAKAVFQFHPALWVSTSMPSTQSVAQAGARLRRGRPLKSFTTSTTQTRQPPGLFSNFIPASSK